MTRKAIEDVPDVEDLGMQSSSVCAHHASVHDFDKKRVRDVRESLLEWYDVHRRQLPWRGDAPPYLSTATHTKQTASKKQSKAASIMQSFVFQPLDAASEAKIKAEPEEEPPQSAIVPRKVSPYETWVSEIMLQQTRVDTVVEYFTRWIDMFPTVEALANASEEDVNALWSGLGYYRRARMLHAGAKYVMQNFNGELPSSAAELLNIPGIGPYTAGAISSIAFGKQEALVDGNVIRVIARLRAVGADPKNKKLIDYSWKSARELVQGCERPGSLNQALMELGATVCTAQNPQCSSCPVRASCLAYEEYSSQQEKPPQPDGAGNVCDLCDSSRADEWSGRENNYEVTRFPLKAKKSDSKNEAICVTVISHSEDAEKTASDHILWRFLMAKRPKGGLLAGQWEFINSKVSDTDSIPSFAQRKTHAKPRLTEVFGSSSVIQATNKTLVHRRDLGELVHIFSHVKHHMGIEHVHFSAAPALAGPSSRDPSTMRWMTLSDMEQLGITTGVKKILQLVFKESDDKKVSAKPRGKASTSKAVVEKAAVPTRGARRKPRSSTEKTVSHVADVTATPPTKRLKTIKSFFKK